MLCRVQKAAKQKLAGRQGASIILALIFLLISMMVSASVVMAASSNAGKIGQNYQENQAQLALSSALSLVTRELENISYTGAYSVLTEVQGTGTSTAYLHTYKVKNNSAGVLPKTAGVPLMFTSQNGALAAFDQFLSRIFYDEVRLAVEQGPAAGLHTYKIDSVQSSMQPTMTLVIRPGPDDLKGLTTTVFLEYDPAEQVVRLTAQTGDQTVDNPDPPLAALYAVYQIETSSSFLLSTAASAGSQEQTAPNAVQFAFRQAMSTPDG